MLAGAYCSSGWIVAGVRLVVLAAPIVLWDLGEVGHAETSQLLCDGTLALKRANMIINVTRCPLLSMT